MTARVKNWERFQHFKDRKPPWIKLYRDVLDDRQWHLLEAGAAKALVMFWIIASEQDGNLPDAETLAFRLRRTESDIAEVIEQLMDSGFLVESGSSFEADVSLTPSQNLAKKNGFGSRYVPDELKRRIFDRDEGKCVYCKSVENIEYDHITPVSRGGESTEDNLQLLCRSCNRAKRSKLAALGAEVGCAARSLETETETEKKEPCAGFEIFWAAYPKRKSRGQAEKTWAKLNPDEQLLGAILAALEQAKTQEQWRKSGGEFIPYPATWLNAQGWRDEQTEVAPEKRGLVL